MPVCIAGGRSTSIGTAVCIAAFGCSLFVPSCANGQLNGTWEVVDVPQVILGDGSEYFQSVAHAHLMGDGSVLVADAGLLNVRRFSSDGRLLWSTGRVGEGPGEFRTIFGMWLSQHDGIGLWDAELRRITYLTNDGRVTATKPVHVPSAANLPPNLEVFLGVLRDGGILVAALMMGDRKAAGHRPVPDVWRIARITRDGGFEDVVMSLRGMRRMPQVLPFSPVPYVGIWGDTIFSIDDTGSAITVRDRTGRTLRVVELGLREQANADALDALRREIERTGRELFLNALSDLGRAATIGGIPRIGGLLIDSSGLLWVKAYARPHDSLYLRARSLRPAGGGRWTVHRRDGTRVAIVEMPGRFTPLHVLRDAAVGVEVDDFGLERVVVYRIDRR